MSAKKYKKSDISRVLILHNSLNPFSHWTTSSSVESKDGVSLYISCTKLLPLQLIEEKIKLDHLSCIIILSLFSWLLESSSLWLRERKSVAKRDVYLPRARWRHARGSASMDAREVICGAGNRKSWTVKPSRNVGSAQSLHCLGILGRWNEMKQVTNRRDQLPRSREERDANEGLPPRVRAYLPTASLLNSSSRERISVRSSSVRPCRFYQRRASPLITDAVGMRTPSVYETGIWWKIHGKSKV